jgi:hypothetical protein
MEPQIYIDLTAEKLPKAQGLIGLFLGGSYGNGRADAVSDIDFVAVADHVGHAQIANHWRDVLETLEPLVSWRERISAHSLINTITQSWMRLDLIIIPTDTFAGRVQSGLKPLYDPTGLYDLLAETAPAYTPSPQRVACILDEFFRVFGMAPVALARNEYVTMVWGTSLMRDLLRDIMLEDCPLADRGGAMHLSTLISKGDMQLLEAMPYPGPNGPDLIRAQCKIAETFLPRARALAERVGAEWPEAFEAATRAHLQETHGISFV